MKIIDSSRSFGGTACLLIALSAYLSIKAAHATHSREIIAVSRHSLAEVDWRTHFSKASIWALKNSLSRLNPGSLSYDQKRELDMFTAKKLNGSQDIFALMNCRRLPARLTTGETAAILGFQEHDITPLIAAKLLNPLGRPAPNSPKYFACVDILTAAENREWLSQATRALARYWQGRNGRKKNSSHHPLVSLEAAA